MNPSALALRQPVFVFRFPLQGGTRGQHVRGTFSPAEREGLLVRQAFWWQGVIHTNSPPILLKLMLGNHFSLGDVGALSKAG